MMPDDELDFSLLPDDLRHLAALIERYAESDDVGRSELLAGASVADLRELTEAPAQHWDAINSFLDNDMQPPGPHQDVACALDSFAQAALEARFEREKREA
jgi:hypothetical protein